MFEKVTQAPADPYFGLTEEFVMTRALTKSIWVLVFIKMKRVPRQFSTV